MAATGNKAYIVIGIMVPHKKQVWAMEIETYLKLRAKSKRKSLTLEEISQNSRFIDHDAKIGWDLRMLFGNYSKKIEYRKELTLPLEKLYV